MIGIRGAFLNSARKCGREYNAVAVASLEQSASQRCVQLATGGTVYTIKGVYQGGPRPAFYPLA